MSASGVLSGKEVPKSIKSTSDVGVLGVLGKDSELAECGRSTGRLGIENGIGGGDDDSYPLSAGLKVGDVGEWPGVLRRTYVEMGVSALRSLDEP
jgi:hypothetical protein